MKKEERAKVMFKVCHIIVCPSPFCMKDLIYQPNLKKGDNLTCSSCGRLLVVEGEMPHWDVTDVVTKRS